MQGLQIEFKVQVHVFGRGAYLYTYKETLMLYLYKSGKIISLNPRQIESFVIDNKLIKCCIQCCLSNHQNNHNNLIEIGKLAGYKLYM